MESNVTVNVSVSIPLTHGEGAVNSYLEQMAKDEVVEVLHLSEKRIGINSIAAVCNGGIKG